MLIQFAYLRLYPVNIPFASSLRLLMSGSSNSAILSSGIFWQHATRYLRRPCIALFSRLLATGSTLLRRLLATGSTLLRRLLATGSTLLRGLFATGSTLL